MRQEVFDMILDTLLDANIVYGAKTMNAAALLLAEYPDEYRKYMAKLPNEEDVKCDIDSLCLQSALEHVEENLKQLMEKLQDDKEKSAIAEEI